MGLAKKREYEVVIIGGGPAGLTAGIYAARARLKSLLVERGATGGWIINAGVVENYPGFPDGVNGLELADAMQQQAAKFGLEMLTAEVTGLELKGEQKVLKTSEGDVTARAVIAAGGSDRVKLEYPVKKNSSAGAWPIAPSATAISIEMSRWRCWVAATPPLTRRWNSPSLPPG